MEAKKAIEELKKLRELMLFDAMTGEDIPIESLSQENRDLYDAAGVAIEAMKICGDKDTNVLTNGDRIRAMGDEELGGLLLRYAAMTEEFGFCRELPECGEMLDLDMEIPDEKCLGCVIAWLRSPVKTEAIHE